MLKLLSWNVNGLRAVEKKGILDWINIENPDILCLQETKAQEEQLSDNLRNISGYYAYFCSAERKGYSGVALYTKQKPNKVEFGLGKDEFDKEGRTIIAHYDNFILFNIYYPNGGASEERLNYKLKFYDHFYEYTLKLKEEGKQIVVCGDFNTAHQAIDLARPKQNEDVSGFLPEERAWIDKFINSGFIDTFRIYNQEGNNYTWWDMKTRARTRNVGWRIDYFFVSENLQDKIKDAFIYSGVQGSDHCPVGIILDF